MTEPIALRCRCGKVRGQLRDPSPRSVNRVICYCSDCQAFLQHLGRSDLFVDDRGGSDIVQLPPAMLSFTEGTEHLRGIRLSPKGLYRWVAGCCNTPVGNTLTPVIPFVGVCVGALASEGGARSVEDSLGPPRQKIFGKDAVGGPLVDARSSGMGRTLRKLIGWRLRGLGRPNPFFDSKTKQPRYPVNVLSAEERATLRAACGPQHRS